MGKTITAFLFLLSAMALAGCGSQPGYGPPGAYATPNYALDAQATLNIVHYQNTAVAQQTVIASATSGAGTAQALGATATLYAQATGTAEANATATIVAYGATATAYAVEQATLTADMTADWHNLELQKAREAAGIQATYDAARIQDDVALMQQERQREALALQRQRIANVLYPIGVVIIWLLVCCLIIYGAAYFWRRGAPVHTIAANQEQLTVLNEGYRIYRPTVPELTAGSATGLPETTTDLIPTPNWEAFMAWRDSWRVPVGINNQHQPIFIDRRESPHVVAAGITRRGKTTGLLWPLMSYYLGSGMNGILVNFRGSDSNVFSHHPNATILPPADPDLAPEQLTALLTALDEEARRRDGVLARRGVATWADLGEGGEMFIAIDEVLTMFDEAQGDTGHLMWRLLKRLTREAAKKGIYVIMAATATSQRNIGVEGANVFDQCTRIAFGLPTSAMSRAFLDTTDATGLPRGQFVARVGGAEPVRGASFHIQPQNVTDYLRSRPVAPIALPGPVAAAIGRTNVPPAVVSPALAGDLQTQIDGMALGSLDRSRAWSLNTLAQKLLDKDSNANDEDYLRVARALVYRVREFDCDWSRTILNGSRSKVVQQAIHEAEGATV
jgi:hypothetical protein